MKFAAVAATVAAVAASVPARPSAPVDFGVSPGVGNACPANSQLKDGTSTYQTMDDCVCDPGWKAYAYPGWGCYKPQKFWVCPPHSTKVNWDTAQDPSFEHNCKCDEGWAMDNDTCVP